MNCDKFDALLDALMDGRATTEEKIALADHAAACPKCAEKMAAREALHELDDGMDVPEIAQMRWRKALREAQKAPAHKAQWRAALSVAAAVMFLVVGTIATRGMDFTPAQTSQPTPAAKMRTVADSGLVTTNFSYADSVSLGGSTMDTADADAGTTDKIIRTAYVTIATQGFDDDLSSVNALVVQYGGRVTSSDTRGDTSTGALRTAGLTLRIPSEQLDAFLDDLSLIGRITYKSENAQDVTEDYTDVQSRLDTQKAKLARLNELMAQAQNVSDLIEIESAVSDAQYMIDRYMAQLQSYDSRVDESTVTLSLNEETAKEAAAAQETSFADRIKNGASASLAAFVTFLRDMAVFVVLILPYLILIGIVIFVVVLIVKKRKKA